MSKLNTVLCESINHVHLHLFYYGRTLANSSWKGNVPNPVYSRLFYATDGCANITIDGQTKVITKGNWYLFPAGVSFDYSCQSTFDHLFFHFKLCDLDGIDLLSSCKEICSVPMPDSELLFWDSGLNKTNLIDGISLKVALYHLLFKFITKYNIDVQHKNFSPCVANAIRYIKQNLSLNLSLEQIAEHVFVSKSSLSKKFAKELSLPVHKFVMETVMAEAVILLTKSDLSIMAISEKLGFCDQFYFSRLFKQRFGIPPLEYKKQVKI